jgi:hypothetical protein
VPIEIEVDLYSGRPNPRFALSAAASAGFERRLGALPPLPADAGGIRDGLGYRGLRVTGLSGGFAKVVVSAGVVEIHDAAGGVTRRADPGRALERWLAEAGSGQLPAADLDAVRDDLAR